MIALCHLKYNNKRSDWVKYFLIGYDIAKWLTIKDNTLAHCMHGAQIFYKGTDFFGESYFIRDVQAKDCDIACVQQLGNPTN